MKKHLSCFLSLLTLTCFLITTPASANELSIKLKGKILLQVEQNGEAWYVNPTDEKRYFMGRPDDAFSLMQKLGVGITNKDLNKIEIEFDGLGESDTDLDGLHNFIEDSYGTDKNKKDTDGDGYSDGDEVKNRYNPLGTGKLSIDSSFARKQAGKILLQIESSGEAWYVNPSNNKRYFLGRPADAFSIMRKLGLGISDDDLLNIEANTNDTNNASCNIEISESNLDIYGVTHIQKSEIKVKAGTTFSYDYTVRKKENSRIAISSAPNTLKIKNTCDDNKSQLKATFLVTTPNEAQNGDKYNMIINHISDYWISSNYSIEAMAITIIIDSESEDTSFSYTDTEEDLHLL